MAPSKAKQAEKPADVEDGTEQHVYEFVLPAPAPGVLNPDPGPADAARHQVLHHGFRPVGDSVLSGPEVHADGASLVFRWTTPVVKVK